MIYWLLKKIPEGFEILDGQVQDNPLPDRSVASKIERGLLGIVASKHLDGKIFVFLSYTESGNNEDGSDVSNNIDPLGNRLYRYQYVDGKLIISSPPFGFDCNSK